MDWRVKALLQRFLGAIPGGHWLNDNALTILKRRSPSYEKLPFYRECLEKHVAALAQTKRALEPGMRVLELGSGPNLTVATILALHGMKVIAVDVVRMCQWRQVSETITWLHEHPEEAQIPGLQPPSGLNDQLAELSGVHDLAEHCECAGIEYIAPYSIEALANGEYGAIDASVSNYVLEHIPEAVLEQVIQAVFETTRPGGTSSHLVDLQDHFGWGFMSSGKSSYLNFRRYSARYWNFFTGGPIAYLNRLMPSDYDRILQDTGFEISNRSETRWERAELPVPIDKIHPTFRDEYTEDELRITHLLYVLTRP